MKNLSIIIPCAGNSSRFHSSLPKSLTDLNGEAFLNHLLSVVCKVFQEIIIPIQPGSKNKKLFMSLVDIKYHQKIQFVESEAGRGDAGAILDGMNFVEDKKNFVYVCWGDTYIDNPRIFNDIIQQASLDNFSADAYVPLIKSKNPYVSYSLKGNYIQDTFLSIDGHFIKEGFEDQSIFLLAPTLIEKLNLYDQSLKSDTKEIETSLLRFFRYSALNNHKLFAVITDFRATFAFNTQEELLQILELNSLKESRS